MRRLWWFWLCLLLVASCAALPLPSTPPQIVPVTAIHDLTVPAGVSDDAFICAAAEMGTLIRVRCTTVGAFRFWLSTLKSAN